MAKKKTSAPPSIRKPETWFVATELRRSRPRHAATSSLTDRSLYLIKPRRQEQRSDWETDGSLLRLPLGRERID